MVARERFGAGRVSSSPPISPFWFPEGRLTPCAEPLLVDSFVFLDYLDRDPFLFFSAPVSGLREISPCVVSDS